MKNHRLISGWIAKIVAFITFCTVSVSVQALINIDSNQDFFVSDYVRLKNYCYQENIKTVKLHVAGDALSMPVIELNGNEKLQLSFDELDADIQDYSYKFYHCTANWEESDLFSSDFIDGFPENQIRDAEMSFNTTRSYIHYALEFPNDDVRFMLSGNYVVLVYNTDNEDAPVLTQRFHVIETKTKIEGIAKRATNLDFRRSHHEVDFTFWSSMLINDPYQDVKICVTQNGRWDNAIYNVPPKYIKGNEFVYDYETELLFPGAGEFRHFNSKDVKFASDGIARIRFDEPYFHYDLEQGETRRFKVYKYKQDINGKLFIDVANGSDMELEADYVMVHFSLAMDAPIVDGNLYVFGELSNWEFPKQNRLTYNYQNKAYELTLLLKQGYYDYQYAYLKDGEHQAEIDYIEGNHYETENDYHIFIYYRDNSSRYDKLIGFSTVNNIQKN